MSTRIGRFIKLLSFSLIATLTQMGGCTRCGEADGGPSACGSDEMCVYARSEADGAGWYCIDRDVIAEKGGGGQYNVRQAPASVSVGLGLTGPSISVTVPVGSGR